MKKRTVIAAMIDRANWLPAQVDAIGVVRLLGKQQPDKMRTYTLRPITETAEQAKGQKGKIAKQILLRIDSHLSSYQVCCKVAGSRGSA